MNVEPVPVSSLQADLPPELDRIVQRAMAKDPRERYQSGADFAAEIRAFVSNDDSFAEATRFFTRVLEQERPAPKEQPRRAILTRRFMVEAAAAVVLIASVFTGMELVQNYRDTATHVPSLPLLPHAPEIHKTVPWKPPVLRASKPKSSTRPVAAVQPVVAKMRVEILHHFPSGKASLWLDQQLIMEEELRNTDRHSLFRAIEMNQVSKLQITPGKHELQVRVVSPGIYDDTESLSADLTAGPEHILYVNCDKRKLQIKLQ
jgi:hypothetical protein